MNDKDGIFLKFKNSLLNLDPVSFIEKYLTLEGEPFRINGNGYRPFSDIYRYIGIKALEKDSKPVVIVKGRQVGGTTMASALEMYFMGCGLFGAGNRPPIRVIHAFPQLEAAAAYSKTKLNPMISGSVILETEKEKKGSAKLKSYMQNLLDNTTSTNDSLHFKQFLGGSHLWIESTGLDANRLRGRTSDVIFFDECLVYDTYIETIDGKYPIGKLVKDFLNKKEVPFVKSFNEKTKKFEYKQIVNAWEREERDLVEVKFDKLKIKCTPNHEVLTNNGWKESGNLEIGDLVVCSLPDNNSLTEYSYKPVDKVIKLNKKEKVYDIEVKDNHNFIVVSKKNIKNYGGLCFSNCQDIPQDAINNATKMLAQAKYGPNNTGVQVYFGTPKKKGSTFHKIWQASSQQYYYLGCEKCEKHFPLYTPGSDEWEKIWIHGYTVRCTHCGHDQDKREAAERGKWIGTKDFHEADYVGFHINQLYMPNFTKEDIIKQKPGTHPTNTERAWQNEIVGEFFQGEASPITPEEIRDKCGDVERKLRARISPGEEHMVILGIDYGAKADLEQLANPEAGKNRGQSYSTAVVLALKGPNLLSVEFATKFKRNDIDSKKGLIDQIMRQYSVDLAVGDIGFSNDFSTIMHTAYGDKYLVSRAHNKVNNHVKFNAETFPKEIVFERDHYIAEMFELMKAGNVRFPLGDFEKIGWLINHCSSMEIKPSISKYGDPSIHYVKGSTPNDGFMALLNAYIAYKYLITSGFTSQGLDINFNKNAAVKQLNKPLAVLGHISRRM